MPAYDGDGQVRDGAGTADITCLLDLDGWSAGHRPQEGLLDDTTMPPHAARAIDATTKVMCWLPSSRGFRLAVAGMSWPATCGRSVQ
jgi:hypothetical protein